MATFSNGHGGLEGPPLGMGKMNPASQDSAESQVGRSQTPYNLVLGSCPAVFLSNGEGI